MPKMLWQKVTACNSATMMSTRQPDKWQIQQQTRASERRRRSSPEKQWSLQATTQQGLRVRIMAGLCVWERVGGSL